jgi:hypothetical protein
MVRTLINVPVLLFLAGCAAPVGTAPSPVTFRTPCEALIYQVRRETGNRLDYSANRANDLASAAEALAKENKMVECQARAQEAANAVQLPYR